MHNWTCNLTGKECIHNNAVPDDGVYENCRPCDVYRNMSPYSRAVAMKQHERVVQHETLQITTAKGEWVEKKGLFGKRKAFCSQCGRTGKVEWKGCPYCLSVMPAGMAFLKSGVRREEHES